MQPYLSSAALINIVQMILISSSQDMLTFCTAMLRHLQSELIETGLSHGFSQPSGTCSRTVLLPLVSATGTVTSVKLSGTVTFAFVSFPTTTSIVRGRLKLWARRLSFAVRLSAEVKANIASDLIQKVLMPDHDSGG